MPARSPAEPLEEGQVVAAEGGDEMLAVEQASVAVHHRDGPGK